MTASTQVMAYSYILEFYHRRKRLPNWVLVWNYSGKKLTNTSFSETTTKQNTVVNKPNNSTTAYDEFLRRIDLGIVKVSADKSMAINIEGTHDYKFVALYYKKIRRYSGDTNNKGELTILNANGSVSSKLNEDTLNFTILNKVGSPDLRGFDEEKNPSGIVFEYRDQVNCYLSDVDGKTNDKEPVFGGYISEAKVSDDLMTIDIKCAGRGIDGSKKSLLKELAIGGAQPSTDIFYKAKTFYDGLKYLASGVEIPYNLANIKSIIESIPDEKGFFLDLSIDKYAKKVKTKNATVTKVTNGVSIRNGRAGKNITSKTKDKKAKIVSSVVTNPSRVYGNGSSYKKSGYPAHSISFKNYCPHKSCGKTGTLVFHQGKGPGYNSPEGEWNCSDCDADYDAVSGKEKINGSKYFLTKTSDSSDNTTTTEVGLPGQVQTVILFDGGSYTKDRQKLGWDVSKYPVFEMTYGLGREGVDETKKVWIPKEYNASGQVVSGTGKWVTNKSRNGYNKDKPAVFHIEFHFTKKATTKMDKTTASWIKGSTKEWGVRTVEFTDTDITASSDRGSSISSQGKVARINPVWVYNTLNKAAINLNEWSDGVSLKFLRKIVLKYYHNSESVLYSEGNKTDYRMILKDLTFRQGDAYSPEVITTTGQKINDTLETILNTLRLENYWQYQEERSKDRLMFRKQGFDVSKYELEEGINGNILSVDNISYPVVTDLCNSVTKVYKVPSGYYGHVSSKDVDNLIKYGEHQDVEVLNEDTGTAYANKLASHDEAHNKSMGYSYTVTASGYRRVRIGEYMVCTLLDEVLNDVQPLLSMEWKYDPDDRPKIKSTYGLGEMSDKIRAQKVFKNIRKGLPKKRTTFSGGSAEVVYDG